MRSSHQRHLQRHGNYIIDQMVKKDLDFERTLKAAQAAGYAEADPSADIDGIDTANKAIISASLAFDTICSRDFPIGGIRHLQKRAIWTGSANGDRASA